MAQYVAGMTSDAHDPADGPETEELKREQARREAEERARLARAEEPAESRQHARRSEKAAYLKEKLAERERTEREAGREGDR